VRRWLAVITLMDLAFSRLDAMLGRPLEELLEGLNLHQEISRALLDRALPGDCLAVLWKAVQAYEAADWDKPGRRGSPSGAQIPGVVRQLYRGAPLGGCGLAPVKMSTYMSPNGD